MRVSRPGKRDGAAQTVALPHRTNVELTIPFSSGSSRKDRPLEACIEYASDRSRKNVFVVALVMSLFLEELGVQLSYNRIVRIPGFGTFGPKVWQPRNDLNVPPYAYPAFVARQSFKQYVRTRCAPTGAATYAIDTHRRRHHHSSRPDRVASRSSSALEAFRDRVRAQARRVGIDLPPEYKLDLTEPWPPPE